MKMINVSVVIPLFNREYSIEACLRSVIDQSHKPAEIIVVDDCSNDNSVKTVLELGNPLIKLIQLQSNSGAQVARNEGVKNSRSEWIAFLDSDDTWHENYLERQIEAINTSEANVVYCNGIIKSKAGNYPYQMPDVSGDTYKKLLSKPGPMFQGLLVKKILLEKISYLDPQVKAYQEWETAIRLGKIADFHFNRAMLFDYNLHEGETISKNKRSAVIGYRYIVEKHKDEIIKECGLNILIKHLLYIVEMYLSMDERSSAVKVLKQIVEMKKYPSSKKHFHYLIIDISPYFYHRFEDQISLDFLLRRGWFKTRQLWKKSNR